MGTDPCVTQPVDRPNKAGIGRHHFGEDDARQRQRAAVGITNRVGDQLAHVDRAAINFLHGQVKGGIEQSRRAMLIVAGDQFTRGSDSNAVGNPSRRNHTERRTSRDRQQRRRAHRNSRQMGDDRSRINLAGGCGGALTGKRAAANGHSIGDRHLVGRLGAVIRNRDRIGEDLAGGRHTWYLLMGNRQISAPAVLVKLGYRAARAGTAHHQVNRPILVVVAPSGVGPT